MADGAPNDQPFPTITREKIGTQLSRMYCQASRTQPIDCFYLQAFYQFHQWVDTVQTQREIEQKIGEVIEKFLRERMAKNPMSKTIESVQVTVEEEWFKVTDW